MPIRGDFYTSRELQALLGGVTRQAIAKLANRHGWRQPVENMGLYYAEEIEPYLLGRNIDPAALTIWDYEYPDGATPAERGRDFSEAYEQILEATDD